MDRPEPSPSSETLDERVARLEDQMTRVKMRPASIREWNVPPYFVALLLLLAANEIYALFQRMSQ